MENNSAIKARILKQKTMIFERVIEEITKAVESNEDVRYIKDIDFLGTNIVFKVQRDYWIYSLDKARVFFESIEDYGKCKVCRNLIKNIKANG